MRIGHQGGAMREAAGVLGAAVLLVTLAGCGDWTGPNADVVGNGRLATQARPVAGFAGVTLSGAGRLIIEQTGREALTITAEDNILPLLTSEVRNGSLILGTAPNVSLHPTREIVYRLEVRDLYEIVVSGAGEIEAVGVDTPELHVVISGAANVRVQGVADWQGLVISGAGHYVAHDLFSLIATVTVSGSGSALVRVSDRLEATVSGSGLVEYIGSPWVDAEVSGTGVVRRIG
jgi:hypothetical protein